MLGAAKPSKRCLRLFIDAMRRKLSDNAELSPGAAWIPILRAFE